MATRNKRKLAALKKKNCEEHPRSNLAQNSTAPRSQEDYITQVSEEIEGRVTKKLSQEISRTENRILGALARLDDFLMNPLLQGYSGITPETSRNVFSVNQGMNEDDSQSDPHPEAGLLTSGWEDRHDMAMGVQRERERAHRRLTWWQEFTKKLPTAPLAHLQESRKRTALQVNLNSAAKTPLKRLRQTKFCWHFSSWQTTIVLQISITILTEFPNCQSHLRQRCQRLTGNLKSSSCLKICSKPVSKFKINWQSRTELTTSILSWGEMHYRHLKTLMAPPERIWEKFWQFSEGNM